MRIADSLPSIPLKDLDAYADLGQKIQKITGIIDSLQEFYPELYYLSDVPYEYSRSRYTPRIQAMDDERAKLPQLNPYALNSKIESLGENLRSRAADTAERLLQSPEYAHNQLIQNLAHDILHSVG